MMVWRGASNTSPKRAERADRGLRGDRGDRGDRATNVLLEEAGDVVERNGRTRTPDVRRVGMADDNHRVRTPFVGEFERVASDIGTKDGCSDPT